jgi:hypothetical protein
MEIECDSDYGDETEEGSEDGTEEGSDDFPM